MYKTKIVIIDSGINLSHPLVVNTDIKGISFYKDILGNIISSVDINDCIGHGTAVYNIIKSHMPDSDVFVINIYKNIEYLENEDVLIYAMNYVLENIDCDIINISLGLCITEKEKELYEICNKLMQRKIIIISAFDNNGTISFPAAFDNVVGVTSDELCVKNTDIIFIENSIVNICAKGGVQRVSWTYPDYIFSGGNSFACAHVTGIFSKLFAQNVQSNKNIDIRDVYFTLKNLSLKSYVFDKTRDNIYQSHEFKNIKNAVIFPFNKEMHSLIRFKKMLEFNIVDVYDIKHSGRVGAYTNKILNINSAHAIDYKIKNIQDIDYYSFDTCILGHIDELKRILGKNCLIEDFIKSLIKHKKNIFSLDNLDYLVDIKEYDKYYYPGINVNDVPYMSFGKLYKHNTPIIGVYGTSSKQGKYTLQLIIRKKLIEIGYKIGQIGTEPTAFLFGMDSCFHFGYNSNIELNRVEVLSFLNNEIHNISNRNVDIIITGCQSGTIPYDEGNINNYTYKQIDFLLATQADAVVLCINYDDEIEYIARTIKFIEGAVKCAIISLVLYPMKMKNNWSGIFGQKETISNQEYLDKRDELFKEFNLPVFQLGVENDMDDLITKITDFFS